MSQLCEGWSVGVGNGDGNDLRREIFRGLGPDEGTVVAAGGEFDCHFLFGAGAEGSGRLASVRIKVALKGVVVGELVSFVVGLVIFGLYVIPAPSSPLITPITMHPLMPISMLPFQPISSYLLVVERKVTHFLFGILAPGLSIRTFCWIT